MMNSFAVDQACAPLVEKRLKIFSDSPSRSTVLHGEENSTLLNQRENHVKYQVKHADYDSDKLFLLRGVKKEELLFQKGENRFSQIGLKFTRVGKSTTLITILAIFFSSVE